MLYLPFGATLSPVSSLGLLRSWCRIAGLSLRVWFFRKISTGSVTGSPPTPVTVSNSVPSGAMRSSFQQLTTLSECSTVRKASGHSRLFRWSGHTRNPASLTPEAHFNQRRWHRGSDWFLGAKLAMKDAGREGGVSMQPVAQQTFRGFGAQQGQNGGL